MEIETIMALGIAFIAVFFGPIITYCIARKQIDTQITIAENRIKAEVLSGNRQEWINDLRSQLSEFISLITVLATEDIVDFLGTESFVKTHQKAVLVKSKIDLLINPKEDDHSHLASIIYKAYRGMLKPAKEIDRKKLGLLKEEIIQLSQDVLKREWERVKTLD